MLIKVKNYEHYNSAMGKYITSRRHYVEEMAKGGYIPFEKAEEIAAKARKENKKEYVLSEKAKEIIKTATQIKDRHGKVRLSSRMIDGMKEVGVNFYNTNIPKHYATDKGGFDAT